MNEQRWYQTEEGKAKLLNLQDKVKELVEDLRNEGHDIIRGRLLPDSEYVELQHLGPHGPEMDEFEGYPVKTTEWRKEERLLIEKLKNNYQDLKELYDKYSSHWDYEDKIYRFYHHSFKVYWLQSATEEIVKALEALSPWPDIPVAPVETRGSERSQNYHKNRRQLNRMFRDIVEEGTGKVFEMDHNKEWLQHTRPIVEAFFHAKYFLEMAVRYGEKIDKPQTLLDSGWAAFLYLYNLR